MLNFLIGIFIVLHGLVHLWYLTLSQRLVEFKPDMGWSGRSWMFTNLLGDASTRMLASILFILVATGFAAGGVGWLAQQGWWRPLVLGSAVVSVSTLILFWDGGPQYIVQKGLLGFLISLGILVALLVNR